MASKGALSVSDIIKLKRLKINNEMYNNDQLRRIPATERESIISRKPMKTTATENYIIQSIFGRPSVESSQFGNILYGGVSSSDFSSNTLDANSALITTPIVFAFYGGDSTVVIIG